ncbi:MAG: hypothetical protein WAN72_16670, partial [Candidatus Acidiferrales bacterium]
MKFPSVKRIGAGRERIVALVVVVACGVALAARAQQRDPAPKSVALVQPSESAQTAQAASSPEFI